MTETSTDSAPEFPKSISKDAINALPLFRFDGQIHLIAEDKQVPAAAKALRRERCLGFDTETRPSFRKGQHFPPALLQLAGHREVWLFQLLQLQQLDPILEILADETIIKTGVAIADDLKKLEAHHGVVGRGCVEIADLTTRAGIRNTGLRSLAGILLKQRVSKSAQVTNWSRTQLTEAQVTYAATDAWVSRELFAALVQHHACPYDPEVLGTSRGRNGRKPQVS